MTSVEPEIWLDLKARAPWGLLKLRLALKNRVPNKRRNPMADVTLKSLHNYLKLLENASELKRRLSVSSNPRTLKEGLHETADSSARTRLRSRILNYCRPDWRSAVRYDLGRAFRHQSGRACFRQLTGAFDRPGLPRELRECISRTVGRRAAAGGRHGRSGPWVGSTEKCNARLSSASQDRGRSHRSTTSRRCFRVTCRSPAGSSGRCSSTSWVSRSSPNASREMFHW